MRETLTDLLVVLYRGQALGIRKDVGLGKLELHPLAFYLARETDGEVFGSAEFKHERMGVRSPQLTQAFEFFNDGDNMTLFEMGERGVPETDEYCRLEAYGDFDVARQRMSELSQGTLSHIDIAVETVVHDRLTFIKHENARMWDQVTPYDVSVPEKPDALKKNDQFDL